MDLTWKALSADYAQYHRDPRNRLCHMAGIPLIVFCVVRWSQVAGGLPPAAVLVLPVYLYWDFVLGLVMTAVILAMWLVARTLPAWPFFLFFAIGWLLQLVGHRYEGKSPAFTRNFVHLLVGPLWILREATVAIFLR